MCKLNVKLDHSQPLDTEEKSTLEFFCVKYLTYSPVYMQTQP